MTSFGETLKRCIKDNNINVYQLAKKSGVTRTYIYKFSSKDSIPNEELFEKLIAALPVSPFEKDELRMAYLISKDGEFLYNQREQVKRLIERMHDIQAFRQWENIHVSQVPAAKDEAIEVMYGELSVNGLIEDMLTREMQNESPFIRFIMPHGHNIFYEMLLQKHIRLPFKTECIFEFSKLAEIGKARRNTNLDVIETLLPFTLSAENGFQAYYVYSFSPIKVTATLPMPYFMVASGRVATFTADMQTAVLLNSEQAAKCYGGIFDNMKEKSNPLTKRITSFEEIVQYYVNCVEKEVTGMSGFGSHPCIALYYDTETLEARISAEVSNREQLIKSMEIVPQFMQSLTKNGIPSYFTLNGLDVFVKEGIIQTLRAFREYSVQERINTLQKMITDTENDAMLFRIINTSKLRIPDSFYMDVFSGSHINIVKAFDTGLSTVNISEESVVEAFHDFLNSTAAAEIAYSKNDTLQTLHSALETLT